MNFKGLSRDDGFAHIYNDSLDSLCLTDNQRHGLLFYLGSNLSFAWSKSVSISYQSIVSNYSDVEHYANRYISLYCGMDLINENLNDFFEEALNLFYTADYILRSLGDSEPTDLKDTFKHYKGIDGTLDIKMLNPDFDQDWIENFDFNAPKRLALFNEIYYQLFEKLGSKLKKFGSNFEDSYRAGFHVVSTSFHYDAKGTMSLLDSLFKAQPPVILALREAPSLYMAYGEEFRKNHIFTNILQLACQGNDQKLYMPIHWFHQKIFYVENSTSLQDIWDFPNTEKWLELINRIFSAGTWIKDALPEMDKSYFMKSEQVFNDSVKGASIDIEDFFSLMNTLMYDKYGMTAHEKGWNCAGEFMEFCALYFYETCLHTLCLKELDVSRFDSD